MAVCQAPPRVSTSQWPIPAARTWLWQPITWKTSFRYVAKSRCGWSNQQLLRFDSGGICHWPERSDEIILQNARSQEFRAFDIPLKPEISHECTFPLRRQWFENVLSWWNRNCRMTNQIPISRIYHPAENKQSLSIRQFECLTICKGCPIVNWKAI